MFVEAIYSIEKSFFDSDDDWGDTYKITVIRSVTSGYLYELYYEEHQNGDNVRETYSIAPISSQATEDPQPSSRFTHGDVKVETKTGNKGKTEVDLSGYKMLRYPYRDFTEDIKHIDESRGLSDDDYKKASIFFEENKCIRKRRDDGLDIEQE